MLSRPMTMPPKPTPTQASDPASAGVERAPSRSAAIVFKATTAIQGAPKEHAMASSETLATRQDSLVSTEDLIIRIAHRRIKCRSDRGACWASLIPCDPRRHPSSI
jgi:hypothetical protein